MTIFREIISVTFSSAISSQRCSRTVGVLIWDPSGWDSGLKEPAIIAPVIDCIWRCRTAVDRGADLRSCRRRACGSGRPWTGCYNLAFARASETDWKGMLAGMKGSAVTNGRSTELRARSGQPTRHPRAQPRGPPPRLSDDGPVAADRRQGNPAQEPEPDLLSDQRRRPRSHPRRRRHAAQARATTGSIPTIATARSAWPSA